MPEIADDVEEVLLLIAASGFGWIAAMARDELLAVAGEDRCSRIALRETVAGQIRIVEDVLDRFR